MNSRKTVITFISQTIILLINVITLKITLAALTPDDYGLYGYALSLTGLFMVFTELNLSNVYFKRVAEGEDIQRHYSAYVAIRLLFVGLASIAFILYVFICKAGVASSILHHVTVFGVVLAYYFLDAVMLAVMGAYQALRDVRRTQMTMLLMATANLVFIAIFVVTTHDIRFFAFSLVVKPLIGIFSFSLLTKRELNIFNLSLDRIIISDYIRFALPLLPMSILGIVYERIDGTLIANLLSYRDNGYFTAASMFNTLILIPSTAIMTLLYSSYSEETKKNNLIRVQEISYRATKYISVLVSFIAMFFFFNAEPIVVIAMSRDYLPVVPIMRVFMFQVVLMSVSRTFDSILMASERLRLISLCGISLYLFGIILDFILIPKQLLGLPMMNLGATGPAYKALVFYAISICITAFFLKRIMKISIYWRFLLHLVAAFVAGVAMEFFLNVEKGIQGLLLSFGFFLTFYGLLLILFREITYSDTEYLSRALRVWRTPAEGNVE